VASFIFFVHPCGPRLAAHRWVKASYRWSGYDFGLGGEEFGSGREWKTPAKLGYMPRDPYFVSKKRGQAMLKSAGARRLRKNWDDALLGQKIARRNASWTWDVTHERALSPADLFGGKTPDGAWIGFLEQICWRISSTSVFFLCFCDYCVLVFLWYWESIN